MADGRILEWETLECPQCRGTHFLSRHSLRQKPGSGITAEAQGWQCAGCGNEANLVTMQRQLRVRAQRAQLAALEAELGAEPTPTAPRAAAPLLRS
jgi:hypothetical protein